MAMALWVWLQLTGSVSPWIVGAGGVVLGALIYFVVALALGAPEARRVWTMVTRTGRS
jgi:Na+/H+ antiporter NhaA